MSGIATWMYTRQGKIRKFSQKYELQFSSERHTGSLFSCEWLNYELSGKINGRVVNILNKSFQKINRFLFFPLVSQSSTFVMLELKNKILKLVVPTDNILRTFKSPFAIYIEGGNLILQTSSTYNTKKLSSYLEALLTFVEYLENPPHNAVILQHTFAKLIFDDVLSPRAGKKIINIYIITILLGALLSIIIGIIQIYYIHNLQNLLR